MLVGGRGVGGSAGAVVGVTAPSEDLLFLIKSSRIRQYHEQNLNILCAPEGSVIVTTYAERWIQPGLRIESGTGSAIVFADSRAVVVEGERLAERWTRSPSQSWRAATLLQQELTDLRGSSSSKLPSDPAYAQFKS